MNEPRADAALPNFHPQRTKRQRLRAYVKAKQQRRPHNALCRVRCASLFINMVSRLYETVRLTYPAMFATDHGRENRDGCRRSTFKLRGAPLLARPSRMQG